MLLNLNIKNLAVFEDVSIKFGHGFNVITGETGSGKSILVDALFLLVGSRASKELLRTGCKKASISAAFDLTDNIKAVNYLNENNILIDDDDYLIISREILDSGRSINKINNNLVSTSILKELGVYLFDIYGQLEQQYLYKKENHIQLLDNFALGELSKLLPDYEILYSDYKQILSQIEELKSKLINKDSKIEQYEYEIKEIDDADLKKDEEDNLINELKKLSNIKEIKNSLYEIQQCLTQDDYSANNNINHAYTLLNKVKNYDDHVEPFIKQVDYILEELQNLSFNLINYTDTLDINEERLEEIENRISLINRLKRKYGFSLDKIFEYKEQIENEYNILLKADNNLSKLQSKLSNIKSSLKEKASIITNIRKKAANYLENNIVNELDDLNMKNVIFKVNFTKKDDFTANGVDDIEFLMSTNLGSNLNSIQKIVSGGEASRIMLALKKLCSEGSYKSTLIFDEIDTGISGKTAQMAGNKMKYISRDLQVICITHSPQIASISENHYFIEKNSTNGKTVSQIKILKDEEKVYEIARLLSGLNITEVSLNNAKELIKENKKSK